ncbi:MAG: hypothetical protein F4X77_02640 [Acidobacteriia bacterium]|nr:hypothetical protein [Terriglobia bacterium]
MSDPFAAPPRSEPEGAEWLLRWRRKPPTEKIIFVAALLFVLWRIRELSENMESPVAWMQAALSWFFAAYCYFGRLSYPWRPEPDTHSIELGLNRHR